MTPHKCPVCDGTGAVLSVQQGAVTATPLKRTCFACKGKGVVWEPGTLPFMSHRGWSASDGIGGQCSRPGCVCHEPL